MREAPRTDKQLKQEDNNLDAMERKRIKVELGYEARKHGLK